MSTDIEQLPPHDVAAEEAVLGLAMRAPAHLTAARAWLNGGQEFYRPADGELWSLLCRLADAGKPTDPVSVSAAILALGKRHPLVRVLTGRSTWLLDLFGTDVGPTPAPEHFARIVRELYERRRLGELGRQIQQMSEALDVPLSDLRMRALDELEQETRRLEALADPDRPGGRHVALTAASTIAVKPVHWVWQGRLALGTLGLLAGREGVGKSTLAYWVAGRITRGDLPGIFQGKPASVLVAATEDSWAHTIVPRLMAAHADLDRIYRVDVVTEHDHMVGLSMPNDLGEVERAAQKVGAGLMLLDPLMSRLDGKLDTHKDADVRLALEPLVSVADRARMAILGLIHHNKSGSSDPLQSIMGSTGFAAVARSVHTVVRDPDDEAGDRRLFGTPKNNLGRIDLPTLAYTISGCHIADTDEGPVWTGKLEWTGEVEGTIADAMGRAAASPEERTAVSEAGDWLRDYLESNGGEAMSAEAKREGAKAGHNDRTLKRSLERLRIVVDHVGFPRKTVWKLPEGAPEGSKSAHYPISVPTGPTVPTVISGDSNILLGQKKSPPARATQQGAPTLCSVCYTALDPAKDSDIHEACDPWRDA